MIDLEQYLYEIIRPIFDIWDESDIYAVSFFASSNELQEYRGFFNVTDLAISYNTERDCPGAGIHSERRWNYAFWRQNETMVFHSNEQNPQTDVLFDWYAQQGLSNIGHEDAGMEAPVGYKELVEVLAKVGRRFQEEGYWVKRLGRPIPILIHDLEYIQCTLDATAYANPNGEAEDFLFGNWETDVPTKRSASTDPIRDSVMQMMKDAMERFGDKGFMEQIHTAGLDGPRPNINSLKKLIYGDKQE